jgi:hypothetical protein
MSGFDAMVAHLLGRPVLEVPPLPGRRHTPPDVERDPFIPPRVVVPDAAESDSEGGTND